MLKSFSVTSASPLALALVGAAGILLLGGLPAVAQEDPFSAPADAPMGDFDPFGGASPAGGEKPGDGGTPAEPERRGPEPAVILQFRESNPTTPSQLAAAAEAVLAFGRPDEAKIYLQKLIASKPTSEALAPLANELAGATLARFASEPQLQPEGKRVADTILAAAEKVARDPARIIGLVPLLTDPNPSVRASAVARMRQADSFAVPPLLSVLADPKQASLHRQVRTALVSLGAMAEAPLIGALQTPDEALRAQIVIVLGRMRSTRATPFILQAALDPAASPELREAGRAAITAIWGKKPSRQEAEYTLLHECEQLNQGRIPYEPNENGLIELWYWDAETKSPKPSQLAPSDAARMLADHVTSVLVHIFPERPDFLKLRLLSGLEWARTVAGRSGPLPRGDGTIYQVAAKAGPEMVSDTLTDALLQGKVAAALGAIEVFGDIADPSMLNTPGADAALSKAMLHPDQRVRVAAALAIVKLNPAAFAGGSRVTDVLANAASTRGVRRMMVAHPRLAEAQNVISLLGDQGFDGEVYLTGQALLKAAVLDPDLEMILVSDAIDRPTVFEVVQALRKDYRTAGIPVGVMATDENIDRSQFLTANDPRTIVVPKIVGPESAGYAADRIAQRIATPLEYAPGSAPLIEKMTPTAAPPLLSPGTGFQQRDERIARANEALEALIQLASNRETFNRYDLLRAEGAAIQAIGISPLAPAAGRLLALLATPKAQTALLEIASDHGRPLADREIAASAFADAVKRRGALLTTAQIRNQYELYNASETLDAATQRVLGSLLDTIESQRTTGAAIGGR